MPDATAARREYKLAADPVVRVIRGSARAVREILEVRDGRREVFAVVEDSTALDVLEAIRRTYRDGREDRGGEDEPVEAGGALVPLGRKLLLAMVDAYAASRRIDRTEAVRRLTTDAVTRARVNEAPLSPRDNR